VSLFLRGADRSSPWRIARSWTAPLALASVLSLGLTTSACAPSLDDPETPVESAPKRRPRASKPPSVATGAVPSTRSDDDEGFEVWLAGFESYAVAQGVPARIVERSLGVVTYDPRVIELDRSQTPLKSTFEVFAQKHVTRARVTKGRALLKANEALLARIESRFGVPPAILVAIWGLETEFGQATGHMSCFRALATLAYDCRRSEMFRGELLSALRIAARGDIEPENMRGAWAGEMGQTQFLPSSYEKFAVDFDGDGHADLIGSSADALASTASYLAGHGYRAREGFEPGSPNYAALGEWNASENYRRTIVLFAKKLQAK
jgi:membrane-bound lytic murein transglycosylase B